MSKKRPRLSVFFILFLVVLLLNSQNVLAAQVTLNIDQGNGQFAVDDHGGQEAYNKISWNPNTLGHGSSVFLAVFDAISGDLDSASIDDYMGNPNDDQEDTWGNNQSGIQRYAWPVAGTPACVGDVAAGPGGNPNNPVRFRGANTGLDIEQVVIGGRNAPFAINIYRITNNTGTTKDIKVAHFNDFDVASTNPNDDMGYDMDNKLAWQWESDSGGYIAGTALLERKVSNWFLEKCCTMSWGVYADQFGFFTDKRAFNGDKNSEPADLEVDIATDVGKLDPGESAIVAFVTAAEQGGTSKTALNNLLDVIDEAVACYEAMFPAPPDIEEDDYPFFFRNVFPGVYIKNNDNDNGSSGCFIDTLLN